MASPRQLAARPGHYLVSLYLSEAHRDANNAFLRASPGCFSGNGREIVIADADGIENIFPPLVASDVNITRALETAGQNLKLSIYWQLPPSKRPREYMTMIAAGGVGEVAWVDEAAAGTALEQTWEKREVELYGRLMDPGWGSSHEVFEVTIEKPGFIDLGRIYPAGSELTSARFADIASTADKDRARFSDGALPPYPISAVGTSLVTPMLVVVDEDDADDSPSTALSYFRFLVTGAGEKLYDTSSTRQIYLVWPQRTERFASPFSDYTGVPQSATDLLNEPYQYFNHSWYSTFGTNMTWTHGSASVTLAGGLKGRVQEDDQLLAVSSVPAADSNDKWTRAESVDATSITLVDTYQTDTAANYTSATGRVIRRPAQQAYSAYCLVGTHGGIVGPRGNGPMSNPCEVIEWLLRRSRSNYRIDFGGLRTLSLKLAHWQICGVINEDAAPWDVVKGTLLTWLPIQEYLDGSVLRFRWSGIPSDQEVVAEVDLDDRADGLVRMGPVSMTGVDEIVNVSALDCFDHIFYGRYLVRYTVTGSGSSTQSLTIGNGRALRSQNTFGSIGACLPYERACLWASKWIGDRTTAILAGNHVIWKFAEPRLRMTLAGTPAWRFIRPGQYIRVTESDATWDAQTWEVQRARKGSGGEVEFGLMSVPDTVNGTAPYELWGEDESRIWGIPDGALW